MRLARALLDSKLAMKMAILIGKQRDACLFHIGISHLKSISTQFDQIQETFLQYANFIGSIDPRVYSAMTPTLTDLCSRFTVDPEIAWVILRPKILAAMHQKSIEISDDNKTTTSETGQNTSMEDMKDLSDESPSLEVTQIPSLTGIIEEVKRIFPVKVCSSLR